MTVHRRWHSFKHSSRFGRSVWGKSRMAEVDNPWREGDREETVKKKTGSKRENTRREATAGWKWNVVEVRDLSPTPGPPLLELKPVPVLGHPGRLGGWPAPLSDWEQASHVSRLPATSSPNPQDTRSSQRRRLLTCRSFWVINHSEQLLSTPNVETTDAVEVYVTLSRYQGILVTENAITMKMGLCQSLRWLQAWDIWRYSLKQKWDEYQHVFPLKLIDSLALCFYTGAD